jgi:hypothetical protein
VCGYYKSHSRPLHTEFSGAGCASASSATASDFKLYINQMATLNFSPPSISAISPPVHLPSACTGLRSAQQVAVKTPELTSPLPLHQRANGHTLGNNLSSCRPYIFTSSPSSILSLHNTVSPSNSTITQAISHPITHRITPAHHNG